MGANAISRPRTQPDLLRMSAQVKGSPFDTVRRSQTPGTALGFPDTEEVTSSNLVRPTTSFKILSRDESPNGSQRPAALSLAAPRYGHQVSHIAADHVAGLGLADRTLQGTVQLVHGGS
jgi:hypothetical protein